MKRVLITGGGGFIGAWVIKHLQKHPVEIRSLDLSARRDIIDLVLGDAARNVEWLNSDIQDGPGVFEAARDCDWIVHLAGLQLPACQKDPILGAKVNLIGTLNVFEAAKAHGIKSVTYMSTAAVFGADDGSAPNPVTHYGSFKLATEGSARSYWSTDQIRSVGFRPYVVYGPGRDVGLTAGVSLACKAAALGQPYVIPFTGGADFLFVGDLAQAIISAGMRPLDGAQVFALPGEVATVSQIVEEIRKIVPSADLVAKGVHNPTAARLSGNDYRRVDSSIGKTPLGEGLRATIDYFRSNEQKRGRR